MTRRDVLSELRCADPASELQDGALDERAAAGLRSAFSQERQESQNRRGGAENRVPRRVLLGGLATATAAATSVIVLAQPFGGQRRAEAATPVVLPRELSAGRPARDALLRLAERVEEDMSLPGHGDDHHVRTESWSLSSQVDGDEVSSTIIPEITDRRWKADMSGRLRVIIGEPYVPKAYHGQTQETSVRPGDFVRGQTWGPGEFRPMYRTLPLPASTDALLREFAVAHNIERKGTSGVFTAIGDLYRETVPRPEVRAGVLRVLSERSDVIALGGIADRRGRMTVAFATDTGSSGLPTRLVLMFHPDNGRLLASEEVLTETAGKLNVQIPCVTSYVLYLT